MSATATVDTARLAAQAASARNYVYETNMGDYSYNSIRYAQEQFTEIKQEISDAGLTLDELITWNGGCWVPTR